MTIIYNNIIPFKGFKAINIFGVLYVRKGCTMRDVDINHEAIHTAQMKELLYIGFYLIYALEWLLRLIKYFDADKAYHFIPFEKEAYLHQDDMEYLSNRKHYAQWST